MQNNNSIGCLSGVGKVLALFVVILFLIIFPLSLFALDLGGVFFSPETLSAAVIESVTDSQVGERFINDEIMPNLVTNSSRTDEFDFSRAFADLDEGDRNQIVSLLVPEDWLGRQITHAVEALLKWIDEDQAALVFNLEIKPLKDALIQGGSEQVLEVIIDSWPPCNLEQMGAMTIAAEEQGQVPVLYCEPPEPFRSTLLEYANGELLRQVEQIPSVVEIGSDQQGTGNIEGAVELKQTLRLMRVLSQTMWFLAVGMLGLIVVFAVRSWKELSRWWGIPIMLGALVTLLLTIGLNQRGSGLLLNRLPEIEAEGGPLREMLALLIRGLIDSVVGTIQLHSVLLGGLGLVIFLGGWFLGRWRQGGGYNAEDVASQPLANYDPYGGAGQISQEGGTLPVPGDGGGANHEDEGERPSGVFG